MTDQEKNQKEFRKYRLLIADDEENILNGMRKFIESRMTVFEQIYCAVDGQEALDIIYRHHPDIMLLDVQMPGKSGLDVLKEAKEAGVCPKTIILSGYDSFHYAQQALRYGVIDYLLKPCRSTEILEKLETAAKMLEGNTEETAKKGKELEGNYLVNSAVEYMRENLAESLNLTNVAEQIGVSPAYLSTLFSQQLGCCFIDYLNQIRIDCACQYMHDKRMKIYEVAFKVGFHDEKYFSKVFRKVTGVSPSDYKNSLG
ncbi:MAG: response regulator [Lachnospiraceae bacterium]|nr:response regulator [Lachnospiraceae bacterium]